MVYACNKPACTHFVRMELVDGKQAECSRCGYPFIMKLSKLKNGERYVVTPHCNDCTRTPKKYVKKKQAIESSIDDLVASILPKGI
jgi:predicted sulfurtransferase